jgi:hypothetical protein
MNKILFIDTLTTGMDTKKCAIYAIGGIFCEDYPNETKETLRFEFRMRPHDGARISDNSLWVGGIERSNLLRYKKEEDVLMEFIQTLDEKVDIKNPNDKIYVAGFNSSAFDMPFIREWFERNGNGHFRDYFHIQTIDLMSLSAFALMGERNQMPDFHLETAARFLNVNSVIGEKYDCVNNAITCLNMYRTLKMRFNKGIIGKTDITKEYKKNY